MVRWNGLELRLRRTRKLAGVPAGDQSIDEFRRIPVIALRITSHSVNHDPFQTIHASTLEFGLEKEAV